MRRILFLILSALVGVAVALLAKRFTPHQSPSSSVPLRPDDRPALVRQIGDRNFADSPKIDLAKVPAETAEKTIPQPLWVVGYIIVGRRTNVVLSDGRTLTENDSSLQKLERNGAWVDGRKLFLRRPAAVGSASGFLAGGAAGGHFLNSGSSPEPEAKTSPAVGVPRPYQLDADGVYRIANGAKSPSETGH